jgi:hypothetical protein
MREGITMQGALIQSTPLLPLKYRVYETPGKILPVDVAPEVLPEVHDGGEADFGWSGVHSVPQAADKVIARVEAHLQCLWLSRLGQQRLL